MPPTIELRVTRPGLYPAGTALESMEGHYIRGLTYGDAKRKAELKFPGEQLTIKVWKMLKGGVLTLV